MSRSPNPLRQSLHRLSSILQLVVQLGKRLLLNSRTIIRQCLQNLLKLLLWARRNCRPLKGLPDGQSSDVTKHGPGVGASLTYGKETPLSGAHSVGHWDPEENDLSYLRTSSSVPGIVGVTDAIACLVQPSSSQLSLQGRTNDPQIPDESEQDISSSPNPPDILPLTPFESRSLGSNTLRPFAPEMLGRYERNVEM